MNWVDVSLPLIIGFLLASGPEMFLKGKPGEPPEKIVRQRLICRVIGIAVLMVGLGMIVAKLATSR